MSNNDKAHQPNGTEASRGVIPAGWKLVPEVPTEAMLACLYQGQSAHRYANLLAATPTPPLSPDSTGPAGAEDDQDEIIALLKDTNAWQAKRINELLAALTPSADERWNAGLDYGMTQLCAVLKVDTQTVDWDAATETLDGDVRSVMRGILAIWGGDEWQDLPAPAGDVPGEAQTQEGGTDV